MPRSARCRSNSAFSRFRFLLARSASFEVTSDLTLASSSCSFCSVSFERQLGLLVLDPRHRVALVHIEPGALDVELRAHQLGRVLLRGDARLGGRLLDLGIRLLQLRLLLLHRPLQGGGIECDDDVAGLDHRAVLRELDDLEVAGLHRRGEHDRLERPDVAADLDRVDELALGDLGRRQVRGRSCCGRGRRRR